IDILTDTFINYSFANKETIGAFIEMAERGIEPAVKALVQGAIIEEKFLLERDEKKLEDFLVGEGWELAVTELTNTIEDPNAMDYKKIYKATRLLEKMGEKARNERTVKALLELQKKCLKGVAYEGVDSSYYNIQYSTEDALTAIGGETVIKSQCDSYEKGLDENEEFPYVSGEFKSAARVLAAIGDEAVDSLAKRYPLGIYRMEHVRHPKAQILALTGIVQNDDCIKSDLVGYNPKSIIKYAKKYLQQKVKIRVNHIKVLRILYVVLKDHPELLTKDLEDLVARLLFENGYSNEERRREAARVLGLFKTQSSLNVLLRFMFTEVDPNTTNGGYFEYGHVAAQLVSNWFDELDSFFVEKLVNHEFSCVRYKTFERLKIRGCCLKRQDDIEAVDQILNYLLNGLLKEQNPEVAHYIDKFIYELVGDDDEADNIKQTFLKKHGAIVEPEDIVVTEENRKRLVETFFKKGEHTLYKLDLFSLKNIDSITDFILDLCKCPVEIALFGVIPPDGRMEWYLTKGHKNNVTFFLSNDLKYIGNRTILDLHSHREHPGKPSFWDGKHALVLHQISDMPDLIRFFVVGNNSLEISEYYPAQRSLLALKRPPEYKNIKKEELSKYIQEILDRYAPELSQRNLPNISANQNDCLLVNKKEDDNVTSGTICDGKQEGCIDGGNKMDGSSSARLVTTNEDKEKEMASMNPDYVKTSSQEMFSLLTGSKNTQRAPVIATPSTIGLVIKADPGKTMDELLKENLAKEWSIISRKVDLKVAIERGITIDNTTYVICIDDGRDETLTRFAENLKKVGNPKAQTFAWVLSNGKRNENNLSMKALNNVAYVAGLHGEYVPVSWQMLAGVLFADLIYSKTVSDNSAEFQETINSLVKSIIETISLMTKKEFKEWDNTLGETLRSANIKDIEKLFNGVKLTLILPAIAPVIHTIEEYQKADKEIQTSL
ncbi:MAG: hypothetical protein ABIH09_00205, partial [Candidatus Omnitrophota bacterium]